MDDGESGRREGVLAVWADGEEGEITNEYIGGFCDFLYFENYS